MLGTGTDTDRRLKPVGWSGNGTTNNEARGHIIGRQLGGSGRDIENLMTLTQNPTNSSHMTPFENKVARLARKGNVVDYQVRPLYEDASLAPSGVLMVAIGSGGPRAARVIQNPAGKPK
jgi:hypothetical protein